jgi:hypothetical protein
MMLKQFMDVYYDSVGTAIGDTNQTSTWQLLRMTGTAASFYSLTGASQKASQAVNTASRDLIEHAWYVKTRKISMFFHVRIWILVLYTNGSYPILLQLQGVW